MASIAKLLLAISVMGVPNVNAWAEPVLTESQGQVGQCRDAMRGLVLATREATCSPSRYARPLQGQKRQALERDALLHFRAGEQRPRLIRAAVEPGYAVHGA